MSTSKARSNRFLRTTATALVTAIMLNLLPAGVPLVGVKIAFADPGTYIDADPRVFSSYGGHTTVTWDYDYGHSTKIEVRRNGTTLVHSWSGWYGGGDNAWTWRGQTFSGPADDGTYTIEVIPDDDMWMYSKTIGVTVYNPPPGAPTVNVTKDEDGNLIAEGDPDVRAGIPAQERDR